MVKPNYRQQKRQKEISKKARHDEKLLKRTARLQSPEEQAAADAQNAGQNAGGDAVATPAAPQTTV